MADHGTSRIRPNAYWRTPSEQISYVTGSKNCHIARASAATARSPASQLSASHATMTPTHRTPAGNSQDQRRQSASGQLRQRMVADGDSASTCFVKLLTVDPMWATFDQRLLSMPVMNQAVIQYSRELN